jgi:hypothetical protein
VKKRVTVLKKKREKERVRKEVKKRKDKKR